MRCSLFARLPSGHVPELLVARRTPRRRWRTTPVQLVENPIPLLVDLRIARAEDHAKFVRNEERSEQFPLTLDHVARSKIAQRTGCTGDIAHLSGRIDRDERESLG